LSKIGDGVSHKCGENIGHNPGHNPLIIINQYGVSETLLGDDYQGIVLLNMLGEWGYGSHDHTCLL
jgi:hypothetical protein